jgi:hypothetical protein
MELAVRLTAAAESAPDSRTAGLAVGAFCATLLLGVGVAHYAGVAKWMAQFWLFSTTTVLALAWLGGGALLVGAAVGLLDGDGAVRTASGLLLGVAGMASWLVGFVGLFWLPRRLKPRWLRESPPQPRKAPR